MRDHGSENQVPEEGGQFHVEEKTVDLSGTTFEAWVALGLFWLLGITVFYQFFTRYVLNDSAGWTEEVARYLLIGTVFIGAVIGVSKNQHIHVDFLYRLMPAPVGRVLSTAVDVLRVLFFGICVVLTLMMMQKLGSNSRMTMVDLPMNIVYAVCLTGFIAMTGRSIQVAVIHWTRGYSALERPETSISDR